jgi:DNA polymerase zeta
MELSRVRSQSTGKRGSKNEDRWGYSKGATLKITGRHVLPIWRLLKSDINLCSYSFENVVFHLLRQRLVMCQLGGSSLSSRRVPRFSHEILTAWFTSGQPYLLERVVRYHILKAQLVIELLDEAEIVSRNAYVILLGPTLCLILCV